MNSREIVFRALRGEIIPRPACGPLAVHFCAEDSGVSLRDFTLKPAIHVECIIRYFEKYRPDAVWISADTWVTAEAMGAPVAFPGENQPMSGPPDGFIASAQDIDKIPPPDPSAQGRQPLMLEVLSKVVEILGKYAFIVGCFDQSPFSLACQVAGMTSVMTKTIKDPPFLKALLEKCLEYSRAYAEAMAACGADMLSTGDSPAGLIGSKYYTKTALPAEKRLFSALKEKTKTILSLHVCGDSSPILKDMATCGADVLEIDSPVHMSEALDIVGSKVALWGNIDPVKVLLNGSREDVASSVRELLSEVKKSQCRKFVLSSGCTLAPSTPPENLLALIEESKSW